MRHATRSGSRGDSGARAPQVSPTKEELKAEVNEFRAANFNLRAEAQSFVQMQRIGFEEAASLYQSEAKDITRAEVAQTESAAQAYFQSNISYLEQVMSSEMGSQRTTLYEEAEAHMMRQKQEIVNEARNYLQNQHSVAEAAFLQQQAEFQKHSSLYQENYETLSFRCQNLLEELDKSYQLVKSLEKNSEITSNEANRELFNCKQSLRQPKRSTGKKQN